MINFKLPFNKVMNPVTYEEIVKLKSFDNLISCPSTSQMMKRLDDELFQKILDALKSGEEVIIS